ncbi:hypothetical protein FHL15_002849 [Xylaria flabelliformis]|uniref:Beta/gamma crystallin 'Greek key' domain-containing protein n=1 Tax=Xylaria flabelliformis TaxID=2512241 RepID=A0A553I7E3_9PEZI|nr:hypothetical protein FHL15_002849 [Xylaria flabelliformis]
MQFNLATVSLLVGIVSAGVLQREEAVSDGNIGIEAITHVFVCVDGGFSGTCRNFEVQTGSCMNFVAPFQDSISAAGPDQGTTCTLYQDTNCGGRSVTFTFPGIAHLGDPAFNFGDIASSVRCSI